MRSEKPAQSCRDVQKGADGIGYLLGIGLFTILPVFIEIGTVVAVMVKFYSLEFFAIIGVTAALFSTWAIVFTRYRTKFQRAVKRLEAQSDSRLDRLLNYETVKFFASERTETKRLTSVLEEWVHHASRIRRRSRSCMWDRARS